MPDAHAIAAATWYKSSHSGENGGGGCVSVAWLKSSHSNAGQNCVEVAGPSARCARVGVRDSKHSNGPALVVPATAWASFIHEVQAERLR
ncbi:DUF397 domain-containing protein [Streptomyces griseocarneus]|uniref:DUF397 domain-containing protein n=1 Tax=Streptomyces griseocarneus TaxID=51201 RepID=UPI00167D6BA7|nr:DUF397 domain-containing protein [Streptomyces griseocarneus]MBZ6476828.1 DUF397 domain-containing protein [Streptomyces griseocarneus]GHG81197.1 toxin [Streptomyces griseocarneus]